MWTRFCLWEILHFSKKSENKMRSMIGGGTTVLYVSHSIDSIKTLCDRVVWLEQGTVRKIGSAVEVCDEYMKTVLEYN